jgi:HSP20 family molecular chaperone IbpA
MWFYNFFQSVKEDSSSYVVELTVPGLDKDDLKISVEDNLLKIKSNPDVKYPVDKVFELSNKLNTSDIKATCNKGILEITIPKKKNKVKEIEIL